MIQIFTRFNENRRASGLPTPQAAGQAAPCEHGRRGARSLVPAQGSSETWGRARLHCGRPQEGGGRRKGAKPAGARGQRQGRASVPSLQPAAATSVLGRFPARRAVLRRGAASVCPPIGVNTAREVALRARAARQQRGGAARRHCPPIGVRAAEFIRGPEAARPIPAALCPPIGVNAVPSLTGPAQRGEPLPGRPEGGAPRPQDGARPPHRGPPEPEVVGAGGRVHARLASPGGAARPGSLRVFVPFLRCEKHRVL